MAAMLRSSGRAVEQLDGPGEAWMDGRFGRGQVERIADARGIRRVCDELGPFVQQSP